MIYGPNGMPMPTQRGISDQALQMILTNHEERLNALAGQQINIGLLGEFMRMKLENLFEELDFDEQEFYEFRDRRWAEMQEQSKQIQKDMKTAEEAAKEVVEEAASAEEKPASGFENIPSLANATPVEIPGLDLS